MRLDILRFSHSTRALRFSGRRKYGSYKGHPLVFRLSSDQNSKIPDTDDSESSIQSSTSSSSDEHDATNASARKNIFPWRHEEDLLPRIIPGTLDNATKGHLLSTTKMTPGNSTLNALATSFMFLDVPLYQFLFFGSWKEDLAESMSWAFTQGTTGLLSNLATHVPTNEIIKDDYQVDFRHTIDSSNIAIDDDASNSNFAVPLQSMMDEKVISFYQSAKENLTFYEQVEVCLKTVPFSAEVISLYSIPYVSRSNTQKDPALLEFYRTMLNKPSMDRAPDLNQLRRKYLETGIMESTVIAQVLVWCNEIFYVKDVASGKVLQGKEDAESRNIPHLLRMEMTVKTEKDAAGTFRNSQGNWTITDIDDHLDGNLLV